MPVGCDHQLNVTAQRDQCGVWCGDGSSCVRFSGTYRTTEHSGGTFSNPYASCAEIHMGGFAFMHMV